MSEWTKSSEKHPEKPGKLNYEHVPCLVIRDGEFQILLWNCEHLCWDDESGDDYECDLGAVSHWMPLSKIPKPIDFQ